MTEKLYLADIKSMELLLQLTNRYYMTQHANTLKHDINLSIYIQFNVTWNV